MYFCQKKKKLNIFIYYSDILLLFSKELNKEVFAPVSTDDKEDDVQESDATSVSNTVRDLHMELIFMYHRVSLKLAGLGPGKNR